MPTDESFFEPASSSSVLSSEIERFSAMAEEWWNPQGPMKPLHAMNETRLKWIHAHFSQHVRQGFPIRSVLDLGCGAGLASEGMARRGYNVLGVDASKKAIEAAKSHLHHFPLDKKSGTLSYQAGSAEDLRDQGKTFDAILALEIIEHVADPTTFVQTLSGLLNPNGLIVFSTLNRTMLSLLIAKIGAEYLLRLLPIGTHEWKKFITPTELGRYILQAGLRVTDIAGMAPSPTGHWAVSTSTKVNYIAIATNG
ncbi:bifunctional 2-polyprenyl-6-hydroxyphenol methylase/3-demethylubiquinol 3-O-methyltransferase UbiG [Entomobacter blattae]|uniref:Ubiquinone biosynthesis O-methyltransferase n=1 Tax=Entomobacter blattae TaxID=2762277 RepID=A0A7H1NTM6_9PROT|nr:bifunctional 2-polyprenyl-6-hydroxyphenol methylase/3-demethylubiquinol 3-O-methyltransferase UbiG [Entomobacter blattae]QNT79136.1 Ubiquinone biosynthesis O-methyltransferase [Entomobacter blattae]